RRSRIHLPMSGLGQSLTRPTIRVPTYWHLPNLDLSISTSRDVWNVRSQLQGANVRFGSLADIVTSPRHVPFTPNNGHSSVRVVCPLSATNRHSPMALLST